MPRPMRQSFPGAIWHITHRCHGREFLLNARWTRATYVHWLFEARRRYAIRVLNYTVTRNHVHILVFDRGNGEVAPALQLVAGRTAQIFNQRNDRKGAFWEARYHPTLVATDSHFQRCLAYIDLNMVRAGAVSHPSEWPQGGYHEIQRPKRRYRIIDHDALMQLTDIGDHDRLAAWHRSLVAQALASEGAMRRQPEWTESVAVGDPDYVAAMEKLLGVKGVDWRGAPTIREPEVSYTTEITAIAVV